MKMTTKNKEKHRFKAVLQHMAKSDVYSMISPDTLNRIKASDDNPEIRVYSVGGEGQWEGRNVTLGRQVINFFKDAIVSLHDKIRMGLEIFKGHGATNSHTGRVKIGEVVGKALKNVGGKLNTLAAVYIYPDFKGEDLDVASIESEMAYKRTPGGDAEAIEFEDISAIALGNSKTEKPGFPGATLLGAIQAFTQEGEGNMTIEELRELIKEKSYKITDLFNEQDIVEATPAKKARQTEYEHAKRVEKKLGEERESRIKIEQELEQTKSKMSEMNAVVNQTKTKSLFTSAVEDRKLNDRQKKFVEKHLDKFKSDKDKEEEIKDDFQRFLDSQLKEYKEYADMLGVKDDDSNEGGEGSNGKGGKVTGAEPADKGGSPESDSAEDKYADPKQNDLIPG